MVQGPDPESLNEEIRRAEANIKGLEGDIGHEATLLGLQRSRMASHALIVKTCGTAIIELTSRTDDVDNQARIRQMAAMMQDSGRRCGEAIEDTEKTRDRSLGLTRKLAGSQATLAEKREQRDRLAESSGMSATSNASAGPTATDQSAKASRKHTNSCSSTDADLFRRLQLEPRLTDTDRNRIYQHSGCNFNLVRKLWGEVAVTEQAGVPFGIGCCSQTGCLELRGKCLLQYVAHP